MFARGLKEPRGREQRTKQVSRGVEGGLHRSAVQQCPAVFPDQVGLPGERSGPLAGRDKAPLLDCGRVFVWSRDWTRRGDLG